MRRLKRSDDIDDLFKQMENVFNQFQEKGMDFASELKPAFPVDIAEEDGKYILTADMPGVDKDEINIKADAEGVEILQEREISQTVQPPCKLPFRSRRGKHRGKLRGRSTDRYSRQGRGRRKRYRDRIEYSSSEHISFLFLIFLQNHPAFSKDTNFFQSKF